MVLQAVEGARPVVRWPARERHLRAVDPPAGRAAFDVDAAYAEHAGPLLAFAVNSLGDRGAAEDALQEVFVRAWRARDRYGGERGSVRTWLFAIARNVVVDAHRSRARRPRPVDVVAETEVEAVPDAQGATVDRLVVVEALARLSAEHREVVAHVHLAGGTYAELAERTGVPVATLRTRMYYGLRALRATLEEQDDQHQGQQGGGGDRRG
ncbi:sigma-70 family RNA polymerase sigma factor [uncultured Pseudokineococcus sp.]|uniref:sigma-70 family RNA polymerase sigma factor n=1 Tax=uncultured Pseudokineococcus sp. TaxID=1642928 RepID=UPI002634BE96|nr:sigma-70 family RNA polymerase sigma factor [uncultured Pseudokineococcus sp.]